MDPQHTGKIRAWQDRLRDEVRQWEKRTKGKDDLLLRGAVLAEAKDWLHRRPADISSSEKKFIDASHRFDDRRVRRLKGIAALLAGLLLASLALAGLAWQQFARAQQQGRLTDQAVARLLLAEAKATGPGHADLNTLQPDEQQDPKATRR